MTFQSRELYRSGPNGDRWSLVREPASGRVFIEHERNISSGGSNVTHGDRGFPRARWVRPGASGPLASYRDVGRGDRPRLRDQEATPSAYERSAGRSRL
jgi:hypothetical protein